MVSSRTDVVEGEGLTGDLHSPVILPLVLASCVAINSLFHETIHPDQGGAATLNFL